MKPHSSALTLTILGNSTAFPNPGGASAGYLLQAEEESLLVDCGHGVTGVLQEVTDLRDLSGIVISHMHPDHIFDLIPLHYGYSYQHLPPIPLLLPPGGLDLLESLQPILDLGERFFTGTFNVSAYDPGQPTSIAGIGIRFAPTQHFIPGYAMRFSWQGRSLFYSSDTGPTESVVNLARGANLALVEASVLTHERPGLPGHLTAQEAGGIARDAAVESLILTHYWSRNGSAIYEQAKSQFVGPIVLAEPLSRHPV
jgi:ribonuclease BN (tRNA processing enzyme)